VGSGLVQVVRLRRRGRTSSRRDADSFRRPAGRDEAARERELVPPALARVDPRAPHRARLARKRQGPPEGGPDPVTSGGLVEALPASAREYSWPGGALRVVPHAG